MNMSFPSESVVERIGWLLIHSCWQFTLVAVVMVVVLQVFRRSSAVLRYWSCLAALLIIVIGPVITWTHLSTEAAPREPIRRDVPATSGWSSDLSERGTTIGAPGGDANVVVPTAPELAAQIAASDPVDAADSSASVSEAVSATRRSWAELRVYIAPWLDELVTVWCVGVLCFALRPLSSWSFMHRLRRVGVTPVANSVTSAFARAKKLIGVRRPVRVLNSSLARVPMVIGYLRPIILLPICVVSRLSADEVEAILAHELAHIRRHDYLVNLAQAFVETLCFYHPAVWWLSSRIRLEREHCCDELAAQAIGSRAAYGRALLALEDLGGSRPPALSLGASGGSLLKRIRRLAAGESRRDLNAGGVAGALLTAMMLVSLSIWTATQTTAQSAVAAQSGSVERSSQDQDVDSEPTGKSGSGKAEAGVVRGVLTNAADGTLVAGARVILRGAKNFYAESDANGRFQLEDVPPLPRPYTIWAYAGNLVTSKVQIEQTLAESGESARFAPLRLEMTDGQQVTFLVTSADTGEPLEGADVRFGYPDRRTITTDAKGTALVRGLLPQEYTVTIEAAGHARLIPQIDLAQAPAMTEHKARLQPGGILRGVVVDDAGDPIPAAQVVYREPQSPVGFYGDQIRTGSDGRFQHRFLPLNAPVTLFVRGDDHLSHSQDVTLVGTKREADVVVRLKRRPQGGSIAGVVANEQGLPLAGVRVENYGRESTPHVKTATDTDGAFVLHDLAAGFTGHQIHVAADGFAPQRVAVKPGTPDAPNRVTVTLKKGHTIHGQVVDENSRPLAGAHLSPRSTAFSFGFGTLITTGDDGRFAFDSLPSNVRFDVSHDDYAGLRQVVYELNGDEPITIQFEAPGIVRGRVVDAETNNPVRQFRVRLGFSRDSRPGDAKGTYDAQWGDPGVTINSEQGRFVIRPLQAGMPLELEVVAESYERTVIARAVAASAAESEELTISLKRAQAVEPFTLTGQFLDHAGQPAAGVQLRLIASASPPISSRDNNYNWLLVKNSQLGQKSYVDQFLSGVTDSDGRFEFNDILPGNFLQLAYWGAGAPQGRSLAFDQTRAGESESITIKLPAAAAIRGTIERANFPNAGSIKLALEGEASHEYEIDLDDDQVAFAFDDLPPGQYRVYVTAKPVEFFEDGNTFFRISTITSQSCELQAGETKEITFSEAD